MPMVGGKILDRNFRALGLAHLVEHQPRRRIVGTVCLTQIDERLAVAQAGEIGRRDDHDVVGASSVWRTHGVQHMRQIDDDAGRHPAHRIEHGFIGVGIGFVVAIEHGRRGEEREMLADFHEQAVEENVVETFRRGQRIGHALAGLFVEVEAAGAERQVEIDDGRIDLEFLGDAPADIVRQRGGADAAARSPRTSRRGRWERHPD